MLTRSILFLLLSILIGCSSKETSIINPADYEVYLSRASDEALHSVNTEIAFWNKKLDEVPESETYLLKLAGLYTTRFTHTAEIEDVLGSDSIYKSIVLRQSPSASLYRALAGNAITQHQFREAREFALKALELGEGKAATLFMVVDINIELGDYAGARLIMKDFTNKNTFPYLIRKAKIKDHDGNLDSAIFLMEHAREKVQENHSLLVWTLSNLADMYGHAGRINEAYQTYLRVLQLNPDYDYALKGIAWIAFSHDKNYTEAKRIITYIATKKNSPDPHLLLAEIAAEENNWEERKTQLQLFKQLATHPSYGDMYNKYLALLEAEDFANPEMAIAIAEKEINNRPTPQSFDLLAWGYYNLGDTKKALEIIDQKVKDKTFEPEALYHAGIIYSENGFTREAQKMLQEARLSSFELGPAISRKIDGQLE